LIFAKKQREQAARFFDNPSRSTAVFQAGLIHANNLLTEQEFARFSPEMRERLQAFLQIEE